MKLLQRSLCGAATESRIKLPGIVHALDRGYQSIAVSQHIHNVGGKIVGTHKRTGNFPFTYGKKAGKDQREIAEKGVKTAYWASKKLPAVKATDTAAGTAYALAYRSGLGKVATCYTTDRAFGPGRWSYICTPPKTQSVSNIDSLFEAFECGIQKLTETQRTPDWFLMRKFRITGSTASRIFHHIARSSPDPQLVQDPVTDPHVKTVLLLLSIQCSRGVSNGEVVAPVLLSRQELEAKTCEELKSLCRDGGLPITGRKKELVERLCNGNLTDTTDQNSSGGELLSSWFMSPTSSAAMKIGSHNEASISDHIQQFFDKHSRYHVERLKDYGLLCG